MSTTRTLTEILTAITDHEGTRLSWETQRAMAMAARTQARAAYHTTRAALVEELTQAASADRTDGAEVEL